LLSLHFYSYVDLLDDDKDALDDDHDNNDDDDDIDRLTVSATFQKHNINTASAIIIKIKVWNCNTK